MQKRKRELILIGVILVIAAVGFLINHQVHKTPAEIVEVTVDSRVVATYDLKKDVDTVIEGYGGGTNHLIIEDGTVRIEEATCPDKVCIHQGRISMTGDIIVCLPNRVIARIIPASAVTK